VRFTSEGSVWKYSAASKLFTVRNQSVWHNIIRRNKARKNKKQQRNNKKSPENKERTRKKEKAQTIINRINKDSV
jgi:hypothetical protein